MIVVLLHLYRQLSYRWWLQARLQAAHLDLSNNHLDTEVDAESHQHPKLLHANCMIPCTAAFNSTRGVHREQG